MSGETLAAAIWLGLSVLGLLVSLRAVVRGSRRLSTSDDPVSKAVHVAELGTGLLFLGVFGDAVLTSVVSLYLLPPLPGVTDSLDEYTKNRTAILRSLLVAEKVLELVIVLVPEALDRHLTRLTRKRDHGHPSEIGRDG